MFSLTRWQQILDFVYKISRTVSCELWAPRGNKRCTQISVSKVECFSMRSVMIDLSLIPMRNRTVTSNLNKHSHTHMKSVHTHIYENHNHLQSVDGYGCTTMTKGSTDQINTNMLHQQKKYFLTIVKHTLKNLNISGRRSSFKYITL